MAWILSVALTVVLGACGALGQLSTFLTRGTGTFSCRGLVEGQYTNPSDCAGYFQCSDTRPQPYAMSCAPGTLFDENALACLAVANVNCNGRPIRDTNRDSLGNPNIFFGTNNNNPSPFRGTNNLFTGSINPFPGTLNSVNNNFPIQTLPPVSLPPPTPTSVPVLPGQNRVNLRLFSNLNGPILRRDQCAELGRLMGRYVQYLANGYDPNCAGDTNCQRSLPSFQMDCLSTTGPIRA